jgi:hypothetical protein
MLTYIIIALSLILIIAYFRSLSKEQRAAQASVLRDTASITAVATATFAKDAITATYKAGQLAAKTVEAEHSDVIHNARTSVDTLIADNGGTIKQAGHTLGKKASNAVYLTDANIALNAALKDLEAKGF